MQYTPHYNLNLPEGSDIVNPLVQDNPNYSAIDTALYDNKVRVVGNAAEIKSGTVHAITRSDSDIDVIRFTATGDWITGDTMTVDGTPVSVYLQDGTAPLTGAYVINTEVVAVINGSRVTLYGAQKLPGYTASDISYDNSGSGLTASDVQDAVDEVNQAINGVKQTQDGSAFFGPTITLDTGYTQVKKKNGIVDFQMRSGAGQLIPNSTIQVGELPEGYRPIVNRIVPVVGYNSIGTELIAYGVASVLTNGKIYFTLNANCYYVSFNMCFIAA